MKDRKETEETAKHWALQYFWEHSPCPAKPLHVDSFSMPEDCDVLSAAHMGGSNKIHVGGRSRPCTALPRWVRAVPGVAPQTTRARGTRQSMENSVKSEGIAAACAGTGWTADVVRGSQSGRSTAPRRDNQRSARGKEYKVAFSAIDI
jgi:hypothetical protein